MPSKPSKIDSYKTRQFEKYQTTISNKNKVRKKHFKSEDYKIKWTERKQGAFQRPTKVDSDQVPKEERSSLFCILTKWSLLELPQTKKGMKTNVQKAEYRVA